MKKIIVSIVLALTLIAVMAVPAIAANEQSVGATVTVGEVVSITLTGGPISFVGGIPGQVTDQGATGQTALNPAIKVIVQAETNVNVDIAIKGAATGALALENWKYTKTFTETPTISIPADYGTAVYSNVDDGENYFYHWVTIPGTTPAGDQGCTISYKAVKTGTGF